MDSKAGAILCLVVKLLWLNLFVEKPYQTQVITQGPWEEGIFNVFWKQIWWRMDKICTSNIKEEKYVKIHVYDLFYKM